MYLPSSISEDQCRIQSGFVESAKKKCDIVKVSALGSALDPDMSIFRAHIWIKKYIRKSGIGFTLLGIVKAGKLRKKWLSLRIR